MVTVRAAISALTALGLTPTEINTQLGLIASAVASGGASFASGGASLPASLRAGMAAVMEEIASASTDPAQRESLALLASSLQGGSPVDLIAVASALSPN
ncbi:MAG: hypothetical protein INF93_10520 [Rhodobacter sp.]|nr:hypothetical protein [Rhodobacter sp.]